MCSLPKLYNLAWACGARPKSTVVAPFQACLDCLFSQANISKQTAPAAELPRAIVYTELGAAVASNKLMSVHS